jgi:hypothetical protein
MELAVVIAILSFFAIAIFRFVINLKWLTAICLAGSLAMIFLLRVVALAKSVPFVIILFVLIMFLLARFFKWLFTAASSQASVNPAERNRILKMVEEGKISADEGKELLDAMGKSSALRGEEKFTRVDIVILCGVGLVVLGFCLPWVSSSMFKSGYQAGYQTGAIGWSILIIAIASAILAFVTPSSFLYKITMLQIFLILIGLIIVISILVQVADYSDLGAGLFFCLAGFIVALLASIAKMRSLAA